MNSLSKYQHLQVLFTNTKFSEFRKVASLTGSEPGSLLIKKESNGLEESVTLFMLSDIY